MARSTTAKPFGERKQRLVLYVGLGFAALAAILVLVIVNSAGGGGASKQPVVVANQDIPADTRVTTDMVGVKFLDADEITPEAFTARSQVINRVVAQDVVAEQQILPAQVSDKVGEGLAFSVSPGMRALSIEVQEVVTAGGNVEPGDQVDIIGVFFLGAGVTQEELDLLLSYLAPGWVIELPARPVEEEEDAGFSGARPGYILTVTLVQDLNVLGVAQSLVPQQATDATAADAVEEAEPEPRAATATLEVTPDQAQKLTLSDEIAILRMAGRAVGDSEVVDVAPVLLAAGQQ